jgi:hypothetical protein
MAPVVAVPPSAPRPSVTLLSLREDDDDHNNQPPAAAHPRPSLHHPAELAARIRRDGGTWQGAAELLDAHLWEMGPVHVSALLVRLARGTAAGRAGRREEEDEEEGEQGAARAAARSPPPPPPSPFRWAVLRRLLAASAARLGGSGPRQLSASLWALARLLRAQEVAVGPADARGRARRSSSSSASAVASSSSSSLPPLPPSSPRPLAPSWYLSAWADAWRLQGQAAASGRDAAESLAALAALRVPLCALAAEEEEHRRQQQQHGGRRRGGGEEKEEGEAANVSSSNISSTRGRFLTPEQAHSLARDLPSALHRAAAGTGQTPDAAAAAAAAATAPSAASSPSSSSSSQTPALAPRDVAVALSAMGSLGLRPSDELLAALCFCAQRWEETPGAAAAGGRGGSGSHRSGLAALSPAETAAVLTALARLRAAPPDRSWLPELLSKQAAAMTAAAEARAPQDQQQPPSPRDWAQALSALARLRASAGAPLPPARWLSPCLDALGGAARAHARQLRRRREREAARRGGSTGEAPPFSSFSSSSSSVPRALACAGLALASLRVRPTDGWMRAYEAAAAEEAMLLLLPSGRHSSHHHHHHHHLACMASAMARLRHRPSPRFASALLRATAPALSAAAGPAEERGLSSSLPALSALGCAVAEACRGSGDASRADSHHHHHHHHHHHQNMHHHASGSAAAGTPRRRRELRSWLRRWQRAVAAAAVSGDAAAGSSAAATPRLGARLLWAADEMSRHSGAAAAMMVQEEEERWGSEDAESEEESEEEDDGDGQAAGHRPRRRRRRRKTTATHHRHRSPSNGTAASASASAYPSARWAAGLCRACGLLPPLGPPSAAAAPNQQEGGGGGGGGGGAADGDRGGLARAYAPARALESAALTPAETARLAAALAGLMRTAPTASSVSSSGRDRAATRDLVPLLEACLRSLARSAARSFGGGGSGGSGGSGGGSGGGGGGGSAALLPATRAQLARCARAVAALPASARPPAPVLEAFCAAVAASLEGGSVGGGGGGGGGGGMGDQAAVGAKQPSSAAEGQRDGLLRALGALLGCGVGGLGPDGGSGRAVYDARTGACVMMVEVEDW